MSKKLFFCENCGAEVDEELSRCPSCGRSFGGVKCPRCLFVGSMAEFESGCPKCHYQLDNLTLTAEHQGHHKNLRTKKKKRSAQSFWGEVSIISILTILLMAVIYYYNR